MAPVRIGADTATWMPYSTGSWGAASRTPAGRLGWTHTPETATYVFRVDLPGVDPKDLDVNVEGRLLTIKGERKAEEKDHYHKETFHGRFERAVRLPNGIDADRIEARYSNGVIEVSVPLPAKAVGRKVPVQSGGGEAPSIEHNAG